MSADPEAVGLAAIVEETTGTPPSAAAIQAQGFAQLISEPAERSAIGERVASPTGRISWAMFEWARNPYVLVMTIYVFAPYFANNVVGDGVRGQGIAGTIQMYSGIAIAMLAPFLGAIADCGGRRKPWIAFFTLLMVAAMFAMWLAVPHASGAQILFIGALMAVANVSFDASAVFHNSLLPALATPRGVARLSGLGLALGNAAAILLLLFLLVAFALPGHVAWSLIPARPLWGLDQAGHEPERIAGPVCALWLIVFSAPFFLFTPDRPSTNTPLVRAMLQGVRSVIRTIRSLRHYRNVATYLLARLFFNDGMTAILTFAGIYSSSIFHWGAIPMLVYGIEVSVFAGFGGLLGARLDNAFGSKRALFVSIGGTALFGLLTLTMAPDRIFWIIPYDLHAPKVWNGPFFNTWPELIYLLMVNCTAVLITAGYANSRTMLARIAPVERMTEFFGLYSLSGLSTSFLAIGMVTWLTFASHNQRIGLLGEEFFLIAGLLLMFFVKEERAQAV
ncbi:MAG: MFS transporter [Alphaproteobacteria bacterium]|jgi:UMF1 family MFS transporter